MFPTEGFPSLQSALHCVHYWFFKRNMPVFFVVSLYCLVLLSLAQNVGESLWNLIYSQEESFPHWTDMEQIAGILCDTVPHVLPLCDHAFIRTWCLYLISYHEDTAIKKQQNDRLQPTTSPVVMKHSSGSRIFGILLSRYLGNISQRFKKGLNCGQNKIFNYRIRLCTPSSCLTWWTWVLDLWIQRRTKFLLWITDKYF